MGGTGTLDAGCGSGARDGRGWAGALGVLSGAGMADAADGAGVWRAAYRAGAADGMLGIGSGDGAESLPETLRDMAGRFGMPFVRRLVGRFGGATLSIPVKSREAALSRELGRWLGPDGLSRFLHHYGGTKLYVPTLRREKVRARDAAINAERDDLDRRGLSERALVAVLAVRHGLSDRQVWRILKKPRIPACEGAAS